MSLSISSSDPTSRATLPSDDAKKTEDTKTKHSAEFDFTGHAYAAVHLPTGLMAATPSKAQLAQDVKDTSASGKKILEDLKSPELQKLLQASGAVAIDTVHLTKDVYDLANEGAQACEGNPLAIAKAVLAVGSTFADSLALGLHLKQLDTANTPEARAKLDELVHDLESFGKSAAKLQSDLTKLAATPVFSSTTGRI